MTKVPTGGRLRIPIKMIEGKWELALGGLVPVKEGADAELFIERSAISDKKFLDAIKRRERHRVLDEGQSLLVGLTIKPEKPLPSALQNHLIHLDHGKMMTERVQVVIGDRDEFCRINAFVEVKLAEMNVSQMRLFGDERGGLWLLSEGFKAKGLASSTILMDKALSAERVTSLNHALTVLSEKFETWRTSHTGNIYNRIFYKEKSGKWYPLNVLRNHALDKSEYEIANQLWRDFLAKMSPSQQASR